jgi:hypothetical protein
MVTKFSPILGKWYYYEDSSDIEFANNGKFTFEFPGNVWNGTYKLPSHGVINLDINGGPSHEIRTIFGSNIWQYTISGDTMTVQANGGTYVLSRISPTTTITGSINFSIANRSKVCPS